MKDEQNESAAAAAAAVQNAKGRERDKGMGGADRDEEENNEGETDQQLCSVWLQTGYKSRASLSFYGFWLRLYCICCIVYT